MSDNKIINYIDAADAVKDTDYLNSIFEVMSKRFPEEFEHAQGRSNFQIEKFIGLDNFTISAAYKHVLKNAQIMRKELFRVIKEGIEFQREFEYRWKGKDVNQPIECKTKEGGIKLHWFDLDNMDYNVYMNDLKISIKDKVQQLSFFDKILDTLIEKNGGAITKDQFDAEEPVYWERRFKKQISDEVLNRLTGVNGGNLESVRNAIAPTIIPNSINRINSENFPKLELLIDDPKKFIEDAHKSFMDAYVAIAADPSQQVIESSATKAEEALEDCTNSPEFNVDIGAALGIGVKKQH